MNLAPEDTDNENLHMNSSSEIEFNGHLSSESPATMCLSLDRDREFTQQLKGKSLFSRTNTEEENY